MGRRPRNKVVGSARLTVSLTPAERAAVEVEARAHDRTPGAMLRERGLTPQEWVHFDCGYTVAEGVLVEKVGSGVVVGRIEVRGGRETALLVTTADGPRVVREKDLVVPA